MNSAPSPPETKGRRFGISKLLLVAIFPVLGLLVALFFAWQRRIGLDVEQELAGLRAAGEPVTVQDMEAFYHLPEGRDDCTKLYLMACTPLGDAAFAEAAAPLPYVGDGPEPPAPGEPWAERERAEAFLARYQTSLDLLHQAAEKHGGARYPLDFNHDLFNVAISGLRCGGRLLCLECSVHAHRKDAHAASQSLRASWRIGESFEMEPYWVSQLVRCAFSNAALHNFEQLVGNLDVPGEDIRVWQQELRSPDHAAAVRRAARGERFFGLQSLRRMERIGDEPRARWSLRLLGSSIQWEHLHRMNRFVAAADAPWPQNHDAMIAIWSDLEDNPPSPWWSPIRSAVAEYAPGTTLIQSIGFSPAAKARTADAALAALLFHREHGSPPQSINELVPAFLPEVPIDPFNGQPLRMIVRDDELIAYSVGADLVDDGAAQAVPFQHAQPDVTFRIKLRPPPDRSSE